jgi:hypothetical protein
MRAAIIAAVGAVTLLVMNPGAARAARGSCSLGRVVTERPLLLPRPNTFYSVDALNPDIVRRGRTYYLFFSGNRDHSAAGIWRTGVATARSPLGPFRVRHGLEGRFLNGGTALWHGRFWQATESYDYGAVLMSSADGLH